MPLFTLGWTNVHVCARSRSVSRIHFRVVGWGEHTIRWRRRRKKSMFAYLITTKENRRKKKKRGAIGTNDLCMFSSPFVYGRGGEEKKLMNKLSTHIAAAVTFHSSLEKVFLIISRSSTFFGRQREREREEKIFIRREEEERALSHADYLHVLKKNERKKFDANRTRIEKRNALCSISWFDKDDEVN